jgi:4-alpha-glucanotransferase
VGSRPASAAAPERDGQGGAGRERTAGLLLHLTSLPGTGPVGDLGPAAHRLLDWLAAAGLARWQLLPLGPTGYGDSPYGAHSSFAGNPLLVSPEALAAAGLGAASATGETPREPPVPSAGLAAARIEREKTLRKVWRTFAAAAASELFQRWNLFRADPEVRAWLEEWTLYAALKDRFGGRSWLDWDAELRDRRPRALAAARRELAGEIEFRAFEQFLFFAQWRALRAAAEARGVGLIGDLPFYPALDSADVWANRELFDLGRDGRPRAVAGVPPDYFSKTGQLWGNPLYRWDRLAERGHDWWIARVRWQLRLVHELRLDHFRGFVAYWRVPARAVTAARGRWLPGPGAQLFAALRRALGGRLPLLAEDLGEIDAPVHALRRKLGLPGMRVLQFGFEAPDSLHAPHRHLPDAAVYTGTHDNDTSRGWLATASADARHRAFVYLGANEESFPWAMVRAAMASPAATAIVPLQDLLGLGSEARMNTPARESGNWSWRARVEQVPPDLPGRVRDLVLATARRAPASPGAAPPHVPATEPVAAPSAPAPDRDGPADC